MCLPVKPYKVEREWEHAGLLCAVVQAKEAGHRCGYVRVPPSHSAHGKDYNELDVSVHGGLTFGAIEPCAHEDGVGFWFGFDCVHSGDASYDPSVKPEDVSEPVRMCMEIDRKYPIGGQHYWLQDEVESETEQLAEQLAAIS